MQKDPRTHVRRLAWIVLAIWAVAWLGAVAIDVLVDHEGSLAERLLPFNDLSQIWIRVFLLISLLGLAAYIQFIFTKLWEAQETLRKSEKRYRNLFEHANDSIFIADPSNHRLLDVNQNAVENLGYNREELLQLRTDDLVSSETVALHQKAFREIWEGGSVIVELELLRKNGTAFQVEFSCRLVEYDDKRAIQIFARDISDRKQMEEKVSRAQRLEMAAGIAGQVAHDFNNLLSPLVGYPELIKMELPKGHPATRYCDIMVTAARQMADMNQDLLTLSRRGHVNFEPVDMKRLVEQALAQLMPYPDGLTLELDLAKDTLPVRGSPAQISRVVLNLVSNAREAIADAGTITVKTENVYVDRAFGRYGRVEPGDYVKLQVSDDGNGISQDIRDRIFDPFFTTKRTDRRAGTGLGLSIVHVIVDDHSGYLDLDSELGKGTTFSIYLPADNNSVKHEQNEEWEGGTETILVVEDDEAQRDLLSLRLSTLGYNVSSVSSGEEAVVYLREKPVDLLILDMLISTGIDGTETYRQIIAEKPGQKAIILSGFAESDRVKEAQALGAGAYIRKPVTLPALAQAIRKELDRDAGGVGRNGLAC